MTYIRVTIKGELPGNEVWSVNPVFNTIWTVVPSPAQMQAIASAIAGVTVPANLRNPLSTVAPIIGFRVEARSSSWALLGVGEAVPVAPIAGTTSPTKPLQSALVLSLRSDYPGASKRGRLYWPAIGQAISTSSLRVSATDCQNVADAAAVYLDGIAGAIKSVLAETDPLLSVYSPTLGNSEAITSIWVGDVLDVQRRRRDEAPEVYSLASFPPA